MAGLKTILPPASEPVTLEELKAQLRFDLSDISMDDTLWPLLSAAREWCEGFQNRAYITQTLEMALDAWPSQSIGFMPARFHAIEGDICINAIKLPRPPLQSVISVTYTDSSNNTITWDAANYIVDDYKEPAQIVKNRNVCWPNVCLAAVNGIKVRFIAGYLNDDIPAKAKQAIILLASHWFENGICEPPEAVKSLLWMDREVPI